MAIYIPERIKVGYQKRDDTFAKQLAYVIYYDNFGKLRKEKSWNSWRDKDIEPQEFTNEPTSGFVLNKGHTRHSWSHFGGNTTRIRIYDPRGIEMEITAENLVGVLMHTDCSKREITGELVYAWNGTELMLLPVCSEEYQSAKKYTALQAKKFSAKDLVEGATYLTKSEGSVLYIGRHKWYDWKHTSENYYSQERVAKNQHVFMVAEKDGAYYFKPLVPSSVIATEVTRTPPDNYAAIVDYFLKKTRESSAIVKYSIDRRSEGRCTLNADGSVYRWVERQGRWGYTAPGPKSWCCYEHQTTNKIVGGSQWSDNSLIKTVSERPDMGKLITHYESGFKDERGY